jgi:type IV pilus assembly protein PilN
MADIKINLLPWREERREAKKKEFLNIMVSVLLTAGLIIAVTDRFYDNAVKTQASRNTFLTKQIDVLENRIADIKKLQEKKNELLSRMKVIQELQGNRPIIVRLFDEFARRLAPRVFFTDLSLSDKLLAIEGIAESNNRISSQLRNLSDSDWFDKPNVTAIKADTEYGPQASQFSLSVLQSTPGKEEEK